MGEERTIRIRPRTVLVVLGIVLAVAALLELVWLAREVLTWVVIALFLALALNPLVTALQRRGIRRRALAAAVAFLGVFGVVAILAGTFVPIVVEQVREFIEAVPSYVEDLTRGEGPLGFLERDYEIVERVRQAIQDAGVGNVLGYSGTALAVAESVLTLVVAVVTIVVLTFFMLLEGPAWVERGIALFPPDAQPRVRAIAFDVYRTVGGFVSGALLIALIAGVVSTIVLSIAGVPYAVALGLLVALLDLIPLAGATIATVLVSTIAFLDSVPVGIAVLVFFVLYQQVENHFLYPLVYSRTVELSPLAILVAVLVGASIAGVLGALAAIPVAGTVQVLLRHWAEHRRSRLVPRAPEPEVPLSG